jgi:hypothetical protein
MIPLLPTGPMHEITGPRQKNYWSKVYGNQIARALQEQLTDELALAEGRPTRAEREVMLREESHLRLMNVKDNQLD